MKKHPKRKPSQRVRAYARGLWEMDSNDTKQEIALNAGYSVSQSRIPQRIEQSNGFHLAMAEIAVLAKQATRAALHEIVARQQTGEMESYPLDKIIFLTDRLAAITARFCEPEIRHDSHSEIRGIITAAIESNKL